MTEQENAVKTILGLGEERMSEVVNQLLGNETFVNAMQGAITQGIAAKKTVDTTVAKMLNVVNVPTLEDVDQVQAKVEELEDALKTIHDRLRRLDEKLEAREDAAKAKAAKKTAKKSPAKKTGAKKAAAKKATAKDV